MDEPTVTHAEFAALNAVKRGECYRIYHRTGNSLHGGNGVSSRVLWRLDNAGWIIDDDTSQLGNRYNQMLTPRGETVLAANIKSMTGTR